MALFRNESLVLSTVLSRIGYDRIMRTVRQNAAKAVELEITRLSLPGRIIYSGSKAEGITNVCGSDNDTMIVFDNVVCSEFPMRFNNGEQMNRFLLFKKGIAPGYALLQLSTICESCPETDRIKDCLVELLPGQYFISSDMWKHTIKQSYTELCLEPGNHGFESIDNETHGPSIESSRFMMNYDNVHAMTCYCPSYLYSWVIRDRRSNWPTTDVIKEVCELESHAVPCGNIDSPLHFMEWRICYTRGEIKLIQSLPDCLIKVLVLMKAIAKVTLKPISKELSTYIVKNIILWTAELNPFECFSNGNLVMILQYAFRLLKRCLVENDLPSYMIPERNLFANRITLQQRSNLCRRIDTLLHEGPSVVLRVKNMRDALNMLYVSPDEFRLYSEHRNMVEFLLLLMNVYNMEKVRESPDMEHFIRNVFSDDTYIRLCEVIRTTIFDSGSISSESNGDTPLRLDPNAVVRNLREDDGGLLSITLNTIAKYLNS